MKTLDTNFHRAIEILAAAWRWSGRKPLRPRALPVLWAAALLLPAFAIRADVVFTNLYSFTGTNDGAYPQAALVQGNDGYFYGTTSYGGTNLYYGTVFKISTNGALTTLHSFTGGIDGAYPAASLAQGSDGYLYGTTGFGGTTNYTYDYVTGTYVYGFGTVFKISTNGALTRLYSFGSVQDANGVPLDGSGPSCLVQGSDGYLYGTTSSGGPTNLYFNYLTGLDGYGTVFKISTNGALTTLYSFTGFIDGQSPNSLVQGSDGNLYGTTPVIYSWDSFGRTYISDFGSVFKISTNGAFTTLYSFTGGSDGGGPQAALAQGTDGYFYGTTIYGGIRYINTTVFKISTNGQLTTLDSSSGRSGPTYTALSPASDGYLYGTTLGGGTNTLFKISTNGLLTSLYSFTDGNPQAALVQGSDGSFYGTTSDGGGAGAGTIFRLIIVPELQAMTLTNGALNLTWSTEAGGIYQLQSSASLTTPNWTNLGSPVTATNGTLTFTDAVTNAPQRFYRVSLAQ